MTTVAREARLYMTFLQVSSIKHDRTSVTTPLCPGISRGQDTSCQRNHVMEVNHPILGTAEVLLKTTVVSWVSISVLV